MIALAVLVVAPGPGLGALTIRPGAPVGPAHEVSATELWGQAQHTLLAGAGPAQGVPLNCGGSSSSQLDCAGRAGPLPPSGKFSRGPEWTNISGLLTDQPNPRFLAMITYDAHDHYILLFGGFDGSSNYGDTWTFANGTWTDISGSQSNSPGARYLGAMAYDPVDQYVVLFGGHNYGSNTFDYGDTWTFANGTWKNITANLTSAPSARWRANMAYDSADGYLVLFGGTDTGGVTIYNDTWTFLHGTWTDLASSATGHPLGRYRFNMAYDAGDGYVLVFGGCTATSTTNTNDTWEYHAGAWTDLASKLTRAPSPRVYEFMAADEATGGVLLFGGDLYSGAGSDLRDTWEFANGAWTDLSSNLSAAPSARGYGMMAGTPLGYVFFFGGSTNGLAGVTGRLYSDTWTFGPAIFGRLIVSPGVVDANSTVRVQVLAASSLAPLKFNYSGLPQGCLTQNVSILNCTTTGAGNTTVRATVNDTRGDSVTFNASLTILQDPVVESFSSNVRSVDLGKPFNLTAKLSGGQAPYSYEYANLPRPCVSLNNSTLSCRPGVNGTFDIRLRAYDVLGFIVTANLTMFVSALPKVTSFVISPLETDVNESITIRTIVAFGSAPYTYNYTGLPAGCATTDGPSLSCRPSKSGVYPVEVNVTDSSGISNLAETNLTVNPSFAITSFTISPIAIDIGQSLQMSVRYSGGTGLPRFSYGTEDLGCSVGSTVSGSCVPTAVGTFNVTVTGTDGVGASANYTANVTVNNVPWISRVTTSTSVLDVGQSFSINVTLGGGTAPIAYSYTGLPEACGLQIAATFTCVVRIGGPIDFRVTAIDHLGRRNTSAPVLLDVNNDPLVTAFNTSSSGTAFIDQATTFEVTATGGTGALGYTYHGLPPGCVSTDVPNLTCGPTAAGSYEVTVNVTDLVGVSSHMTTWLNVSKPTSQGSTTSFTSGPGLEFLVLGVILGAVAGALAGSVIRRRRNPTAAPAEPVPGATAPIEEDPPWKET